MDGQEHMCWDWSRCQLTVAHSMRPTEEPDYPLLAFAQRGGAKHTSPAGFPLGVKDGLYSWGLEGHFILGRAQDINDIQVHRDTNKIRCQLLVDCIIVAMGLIAILHVSSSSNSGM